VVGVEPTKSQTPVLQTGSLAIEIHRNGNKKGSKQRIGYIGGIYALGSVSVWQARIGNKLS